LYRRQGVEYGSPLAGQHLDGAGDQLGRMPPEYGPERAKRQVRARPLVVLGPDGDLRPLQPLGDGLGDPIARTSPQAWGPEADEGLDGVRRQLVPITLELGPD